MKYCFLILKKSLFKYLQSDICATLLKKNKIEIHIKTGQLFFDNVNSAEIIYKFLLAQQDTFKELLNIKFKTFDDYDEYITKYLAAIKNINDNKYDMLTNKNSKVLFYNFNDCLSIIGKPPQLVIHTVISDEDYALTELQNRIWPYFIERILEYSQNGLKLRNYSITDKPENKIITDTIQNFKIVKELYMSLYNTIGDNLLEYLHNCPYLEQEKIDEDLRINAFEFLTFQNNYNSEELFSIYDFL